MVVAAPAPIWSDTTFSCMGSTARVLVLGGPIDLPERARRRLEDLESRWSRFRPGSELCRLNAAVGAPVVVSPETFAVIALAVAAWRATGGHFDPTVLPALVAAGYDRDFDHLPADAATGASRAPESGSGPTPGGGAVELDRIVSAIRLPPGVHLDLGGIGKGHAADLVAEELRAAGAAGVCVNLGGDLRAAGAAPDAAGWRIDLDPTLTTSRGSTEPRHSFRLGAGAVATSTRLRRRWSSNGAPAHHLIDPATSGPAWTGLATVTVLADRTAWAEMLAKAAFVAGPIAGAALLRRHGLTGLLVDDHGQVDLLPGVDAYLMPNSGGSSTLPK
jgi:thiamine biosynthesis lipoprotein